MLNDTIAAISTALQDGAISIIRISGEQALEIADRLFDRSLQNKASHTVTYGFIIDPHTGKQVDEVLISVFRAPRTYTREDIVEISCHGGRCVTSMILQLV
ncbi:MAG: tRNA uridine-5-carboxymethylaminomethyl(34) synthesis GTPase MnmE, partial [Merdibacter sp.]|nr:tRNA uridine-5-carboxymethylaminomethyl(34) synthesis GTPase MnmE [Merdibacter sp.]